MYIYEWPDSISITANIVIEEECPPKDTHLVTEYGDKIYRVKETIPFGFVGKENVKS